MPKVLIADDDPSLLDTLATLLGAAGYEVDVTRSAAELLDHWSRSHPDLVIADLHMPGGGVGLVAKISHATAVPVLVLSADAREEVKVAALDAGAEDYVTKPFSAAELLARVRVALRRTLGAAEITRVGQLTLSPGELTASVGEKVIKLTPTEFELLATFPAAGYIAAGELLTRVWGPAYRSETDYVRVYIRRLRAKLDALGLPNAIESRPGLGYRLTVGD